MRRKHPTLGKNKLAQMYLLRPFDAEIVPNYTNPEIDGYYKLKNRKLTFFGVIKTNNQNTKVKDSKRIVYLANPETSARLIRASKYILPQSLRTIHAFHSRAYKLIEFKLFNCQSKKFQL